MCVLSITTELLLFDSQYLNGIFCTSERKKRTEGTKVCSFKENCNLFKSTLLFPLF